MVKERLVKVGSMPITRARRASVSKIEPATGFSRVAGHQRALGILAAQRAAGRLAHAYCFTGEPGVGKTCLADALAEELLLGPGQPSRLAVHPDFWSDDREEAISIDEVRFHPEKGGTCFSVVLPAEHQWTA